MKQYLRHSGLMFMVAILAVSAEEISRSKLISLLDDAFRGDKSAIRKLRGYGDSGSVQVQELLGRMYRDGKGVPKDLVESTAWFRRAADRGNADAQAVLAFAYLEGEGVAKDEPKAFEWFHRAGEGGLTNAQYMLGFMYYEGLGVKKDHQSASLWFRRAAEQGYASAQYSLGFLYFEGDGVIKSATETAAWWRRAAELGDSKAQVGLGLLYLNGYGVATDLVESYMWLNLAAAQGDKDARERRDLLEKRMTFENVQEAQRRSTAMLAEQSPSRSRIAPPPTPTSSSIDRDEEQRKRNRRIGDVLMSLGTEMMRQTTIRSESNQKEASLSGNCGLRPLGTKPLRVGCRDMVQTCSCTNAGSCSWVWTCVP